MKTLLLSLSFLFFSSAAHASCFPLVHVEPSDPALFCASDKGEEISLYRADESLVEVVPGSRKFVDRMDLGHGVVWTSWAGEARSTNFAITYRISYEIFKTITVQDLNTGRTMTWVEPPRSSPPPPARGCNGRGRCI